MKTIGSRNAAAPKPHTLAPSTSEAPLSRWRAGLLVRVATAALIATVYGLTLHPGVNRGDSADIQYSAATLGVCHSPGYQIEVHFGKLFSLLPAGNVAWRINLMMLVFGTIGCMALYDALLRITAGVFPAFIGATTLAFSSIFWTHAIVAEAYVFYGAFLLMGLWAAVRFVQTHKAVWLYVMALALGISVWDRASELFVMPAFLLLWMSFRKKVRLGVARVVVATALFLTPLVFSVSSYLVRWEASRLPMRDDALRDQVLGKPRGDPRFATLGEVPRALCYCLGLGWSDRRLPAQRAFSDLERYSWLLSGLGAFGDYAPVPRNREESIERGRGTAVGLVGIALAIWGSVLWRRQYGWILLGWGMFVGNLAFYLWNSRWDSLTFTVPGLAGLALLAGLGATWSGGQARPAARIVYRAGCLVAPAFLLVTNYSLLNRATPAEFNVLAILDRAARTPLPQDASFLCTYWPAMTYRYMFHVQGHRPDIHVFSVNNADEFTAVGRYCLDRNWEVFTSTQFLPRTPEVRLAATRTPPSILQAGFIRVPHPEDSSAGAQVP